MPENPPNGKTSRDNSDLYSMPWFKFWIVDYEEDTRGLTPLEHGVYLLLLKAFYKGMGAPLPAEHERLYRMLGAITREEQFAVHTILDRYWHQDCGSGWVNHRALEEIEAARHRAKMNNRNAKKGGRPRKNTHPDGPHETRAKTESVSEWQTDSRAQKFRSSENRTEKSEIIHTHAEGVSPQSRKNAPSGTPANETGTEDTPSAHVCDGADIDELLENLWEVYPTRQGSSRTRALRALKARLADGYTPSDCLAAAQRYAAYVTGRAIERSQYVIAIQNFFGDRENLDEVWEIPPGKAERAEYEQRRVLDSIRGNQTNGERNACAHKDVFDDRGMLRCAACREAVGQQTEEVDMSEAHDLTVEPVGTGDTRECEHPDDQCKIVSMTNLDGHSGMYALCRVCGGAVEVSKGDDGEWWPADGATMQRAAIGYMEAIG